MDSKHRDTVLAGILPGLFFPIIVLFVILMIRKDEYSLWNYFHAIYEMGLLAKLVSICLIPNLLFFFGFLRFNRMRSARGVLLSMFVYAAVIGVLKIL